ncbi:hypothetical protein SAMN05421690_10121 [Nitrosomonas sp. Nm51]|nr:hypothetical protein SAMN05421690_10121 [Nitrosomonas sp. Nm51]
MPRRKRDSLRHIGAELRLSWISAVLTLPLAMQMGTMFTGHDIGCITPLASMTTRHTGTVLDWQALRGGGANMEYWLRLAPAWRI